MPQFDTTGFDSGNGFDGSGPSANPPAAPLPGYRVFGNPGVPGATTFGQLRFRLTKALPGIDPELIDGWIQDRYTEILDELPWQRAERVVTIQTVAPFTVGTVAIANGDTFLSFSGVALTAAMTGRAFRILGDEAYYEFTVTGAATASLDRPYEGPGGVGLGYLVFQSVYQLPADLRILGDVRLLSEPHPLGRRSRGDLNAMGANRNVQGDPQFYAPYMDDGSAPPRNQIEVYPVPLSVATLVIDYTADAAPLTGTSTSLLPWVRPGVIFEGVTCDGLRHLKEFQGAKFAMDRFANLLQQMKRCEYAQTPPAQMRMAGAFSRHRLQRALNSTPQQVRLP